MSTIDKSQFKNVWVVAEVWDGSLTETSLQLLTPGRHLADRLGQPLVAVVPVAGAPNPAIADTLGQHGADQVIWLNHDLLKDNPVQLLAKALVELVNEKKPNVVLYPASTLGKELAPRVAVRTCAGLTSNVTELSLNDAGDLQATKAVFAESVLASYVTSKCRPQMATVRNKVYPVSVAVSGKTPAVESVTPSLSADQLKTKLVSVQQPESTGRKKLEEADIVVSGGRGLQGAEHFKLVEDLADALGAAVGASRAVVDAGWRPHSEQVGQTGKSVSPKIYVAIGISGALQHLVGMESSGIIIAINRDPEAPIFKIADFGIVGDAFQVVPALTQTIQDQKLMLSV